MTTRVAVPSKGRLRESVLDLLGHAGYSVARFGNSGASAIVIEDIEFIEMRPRDAAAWLAAGRLDAGFISTDTALENAIEDWPRVDLGFSRSDLVLACRVDAPFAGASDLAGHTVATHLPNWTRRWFASMDVDVEVVPMGGSLEGICARGMADAIVDLRETGLSLLRNSLHVIEEAVPCQAILAMADPEHPLIAAMTLRIQAAQAAKNRQYVVLHIAADRVSDLATVFPGLAAPTIVPLAGHDDVVAAHLVVSRTDLWARLADLRAIGATGIVALPTDAIVE